MDDDLEPELPPSKAGASVARRLKSAEAALRHTERRFEILSESLPLGVYHADVDGRCTFANSRCCELLGLNLAAALGDGWMQVLHPQDCSAALAVRHGQASARPDFDVRFRIHHARRGERVLRSRAHFVTAAETGTGEYVGALEDVTELHLAEHRLRASESLLDRAGRIAAVGGWEVDLRTREVSWSKETRRIHGVGGDYRPSVADAIEFYAPEARPVMEAAVETAIRLGTPWDLELPFRSSDGRALWVRALGEVEYQAGVPVRLTGAFQDITERRERKAELLREQTLRLQVERHAEALDRLLRERNEMLDVLAHEVRQPLNNASAALQASASALTGAAGATVSPDRGPLLRARAVIGQVIASIDNTLAVASLLVRPDAIAIEDTDVDTLLAVTIADMPAGEQPRISIDRSTRTRTASMDMGLMRLALRNLLANALRCSAAGSPVTIRVFDSDEPLALVIDVLSVGSTVAASLVPRLFERGSRHAPAGARAPPGLGLGLYIVRRVMELHGGSVLLASNTSDNVTLRLVVAQAAAD